MDNYFEFVTRHASIVQRASSVLSSFTVVIGFSISNEIRNVFKNRLGNKFALRLTGQIWSYYVTYDL